MEISTGTQCSEEIFLPKNARGNTARLRFFAGTLGDARFFFSRFFIRAIWAKCGDLQVLGNELHAVFFRNCASIPIHKRRVKFDDFVAIIANDVSLKRTRAARAFVIFKISPDVEFADYATFNQRRERAVNRCSRD